MILDDEEIRHLTITLLNAPTERDLQTRIGASTLSDGCDYCLACAFARISRDSTTTTRAWMGARFGTAAHNLLEHRQRTLEAFRTAHVNAKQEEHVWFADMRGYGKVGGSIDVLLDEQIIDWKSSTRKKSALMQDHLQARGMMRVGLPPRWERQKRGNYKLNLGSDATASLSAKEYAEEMAKQNYKVTGYFGQQTLYMHGTHLMGEPRSRASLVFLNRDGNGWFDNPAASRYEDPTAVHDVWVLSFDYEPAYADALIARGQAIYDHLEAGGTVGDFTRHEYCFPCSIEVEQEAKAAPDVDIELTLAAVA